MTAKIQKTPKVLVNNLKYFKKALTKPQYSNLKKYTTGLIVSENKTIQEINKCFVDPKNQSSLNRFITQPKWSSDDVNKLRLEIFEKKVGTKKSGFNVIDDTLAHKTGTKMEGVGYHYDTQIGKPALGHNILTTHYIDEQCGIPLNSIVYVREEDCKKEGREFKTKIDMAIEQVRSCSTKATTWLFDAWYLTKKLTSEIEKNRCDWVSRVKSNRSMYFEGLWVPLERFIRIVPEIDYVDLKVNGKKVRAFGKIIQFSKLGSVKIVVCEEPGEKPFILATNRKDWSEQKIVDAYLYRFSIENFYRDAKQNLGLEKYQLRSIGGIVTHLCLVFLAYTLLVLGKLCVFDRIVNTIGDMCRYVKDLIFKSFVGWVVDCSKKVDLKTIFQMCNL